MYCVVRGWRKKKRVFLTAIGCEAVSSCNFSILFHVLCICITRLSIYTLCRHSTITRASCSTEYSSAFLIYMNRWTHTYKLCMRRIWRFSSSQQFRTILLTSGFGRWGSSIVGWGWFRLQCSNIDLEMISTENVCILCVYICCDDVCCVRVYAIVWSWGVYVCVWHGWLYPATIAHVMNLIIFSSRPSSVFFFLLYLFPTLELCR